MADLLVSRHAAGVALIRSVDPFDTLEIYRIDRERWRATPEKPGIYLLYGTTAEGSLTVYIGMSTVDMRKRIGRHHVNPRKNWFGLLFAVPIPNPLLCQAIESELIGLVQEAGVVDVIANVAEEAHRRGVEDVHIEPALDKIRDGLQLLLGSDIFTPKQDDELETTIDPPVERLPPLARAYRGAAKEPRRRTDDDPAGATHAYAGRIVIAWGRFEGAEPDTRFRVLAGSTWRPPVLNPENTTYEAQTVVDDEQRRLVTEGVLDANNQTFAQDLIFDNWTKAVRVVSGKAQYSGSYHWQRLEG